MKRKRVWTYVAAIMAILCIGAFIGILIGMPIGATKGRREAEEAYKRQEQELAGKPDEEMPVSGAAPTKAPTTGNVPTKEPEGETVPTGEVTPIQPTEGASPTVEPTGAVSPTETPKVTVAPAEGTTPVPTETPGVTDEPKASPSVTDTPKISTEPIATAMPNTTAEPQPTAKPTAAPKATATPKPTAKPTSSVKPTDIPTAEGEKGYYGRLHVEGTYLADKEDKLVQLRGVSTHGLGWFPQYVNEAAIRQFNEEWGCNVFRLAMYTAEGAGYCTNGDDQKKKLKDLVHKGVKAAIDEDMYVIIDWHVLQDQDPNKYKDEAKKFFEEMAKTYKDDPHVIYEICNEPNGGTTWSMIKKYALEVIPVIRKHAPNAIIIVGTPTWSQDVDIAAKDPITEYDNVMYALHFYAETHQDSLRNKCKTAVKKGLPIFVTEYGICDASGNGVINEKQANIWIDLLDSYGISHVMWNLANKNESSSMIAAGNSKVNGFTEKDLSTSGKWFVNMLQKAGVGIGSALSGTTEAGQGDDTGTSGDSSGGNQQQAVTIEDVEKILTPGDGLVYYVSNSWNKDSGVGVQLSLSVKNDTGKDVSGWERKLTVKSGATVEVEQFWNCSVSVKGNVITVTPADYNKNIAAGGSVGDIGIIVNISE